MKSFYRFLAAFVAAVLLVGCAAVTKLEGDQVVNNRLAVKMPEAWNKVTLPGQQPFETWTQEGLTLDTLRFWVAVKPGQQLINRSASSPSSGGKSAQPLTFETRLAPDQLVNLFENLYSLDGSIVNVTKVEPAAFAGQTGVHFEFTLLRKSDGVQLLGAGWLAVYKNELFAATFVAPKLSFYPRLLPKAENVLKSAQIKA